jgi:hypothetical protein
LKALEIIKTAAISAIALSFCFMAFKFSEFNGVHLWTYDDEMNLRDELKGVNNVHERREIIRDRKKNSLYISVDVDGPVGISFNETLSVSLRDSSVPVSLTPGGTVPVSIQNPIQIYGSVLTGR